MAIDPETLDPKRANILYHDWEAEQYDDKWSISFDERCIAYAREKFTKIAPARTYPDVLEIGTGTGFFIVNLWQAGLVERGWATDISQGMVDVCLRNAKSVGFTALQGRTADAEALPFEDRTFDLVVGHAFLHHLPDPQAAMREAYRVLKPGGSFVVCGEPTRVGHAIVGVARRATARAWKTLAPPSWRKPPENGAREGAAALEAHVDLHEFHPHMVRAWAREAGFDPVRIETEELVSGLFGWSVRTIEALARPGLLGERWAWFAYRNYMRLYHFDHLVSRRVVPKPLFYNLLMNARRPEGS